MYLFLVINKMEEYYKSVGCDYVILNVLAYNEIDKKYKNGYSR